MLHFLYHLPHPSKDPNVLYSPDPLIVGSTAQVIDRNAKPTTIRLQGP